MTAATFTAAPPATLAQRLQAGIGLLTAIGTAVLSEVREAMRLDRIMRGYRTLNRSAHLAGVKRAVLWSTMLNATLAGARVVITGIAPTPRAPAKPSTPPDPAAVAAHVAASMASLAAIMAGGMAALPPLPTFRLRPLLPKPTVSMVRAFNTEPIGVILTRICKDLGITERAPEWPADLIGVTQTPAEWLAERFPLNAESPTAESPTAEPSNAEPPTTPPQPPALSPATLRAPYPPPPPRTTGSPGQLSRHPTRGPLPG